MRAALLTVLAFAAGTSGLPASYVLANQQLLWKSFKETYNKNYSVEEEPKRMQVFVKNMLEAAELEKQNPKAQFGSSPFADLTAEEFKVYHSLSFPKKESPPRMFTDELAATADAVDWRTKGAVTQVKNQGQCGSCWSFSTTGGIEGQWFLAGHTLTSLSEQMFVSCDTNDDGCNGGLMDNAFKWVISAHSGKVVTEASYPYKSSLGVSHACEWSASLPVGATITSHKDIAHNEADMATWVSTNGPLSIAVDAATGWQTYTGGIMSTCTGRTIDHGVLIVGWTSEYWIVKNSWGPSWGENGYIRLAYGSNQCDITSTPCTSVV